MSSHKDAERVDHSMALQCPTVMRSSMRSTKARLHLQRRRCNSKSEVLLRLIRLQRGYSATVTSDQPDATDSQVTTLIAVPYLQMVPEGWLCLDR